MMTGTFDAKRAHELFAAGASCRAIAAELGVAASTVSRWAKGAGLTFDRSQVAAAVQAHTVDLAAGRIRLAEKMLAASNRLLDELDGPYLVYSFGGRDNTYAEHELARAPVEVHRNVVTTAGITFDKLTRVVETSGSGSEDARSMLAQLGRALGVGADTVDNSGE